MFKRILTATFVALILVSAATAQKLKAEDIVAKHVESIGSAEKRAAMTSMMAVGDATVVFVTQKNQTAIGRIVVASTGPKMFLGLNLNAADYPQEKFSFDGKDAHVAYVRLSERSVLGNFLLSNKGLIEDSLLGGTLFSSWSLANPNDNKAKISGGGTKKIDGKEVYVIDYSPKGGSDVSITLYFDKETFRHVRSEYKQMSSAGIGLKPEQSSGYIETRTKVIEDYGDFKDESGLMLPHSYSITYSISGQRGTNEVQWKFALTEFAFNQKFDDATFNPDAKQGE